MKQMPGQCLNSPQSLGLGLENSAGSLLTLQSASSKWSIFSNDTAIVLQVESSLVSTTATSGSEHPQTSERGIRPRR